MVRPITVAELIAKLQTYPPETYVVFQEYEAHVKGNTVPEPFIALDLIDYKTEDDE